MEYLNVFRKFYKWHYPRHNLEPGDVVFLCEDGASVNNWPMGRIQEVHPWSDGIVQAVTVKTARGTYKRPIVKTFSLLLYDEDEL